MISAIFDFFVVLPLKLMWYMIVAAGYIIYWSFYVMYYAGKMLANLIVAIIGIINKSSNANKSNPNYRINKVKNTNSRSTFTVSNNNPIIDSNNSYLKIYINKKVKNSMRNDELYYERFGMNWSDTTTVYYVEDLPNCKVFEANDTSSAMYGELLNNIYKKCENDFYATIGYEENKITYKIDIKDNDIYINDKNISYWQNKYTQMKNKINSFSSNLYDYSIYIENDNFFDDVVPISDLGCDSIEELSDKLKETDDILLFEIPYMEEITKIIDIILPKINIEYNKCKQKVMDSLPDIVTINEPEEQKNTKKENKKNIKTNNNKEIKTLWDKMDDAEAIYYGLTDEEKEYCKKNYISPREYVEDEEKFINNK